MSLDRWTDGQNSIYQLTYQECLLCQGMVQLAKHPLEDLPKQLECKRKEAARTAASAEKAKGAKPVALVGLRIQQEGQVLALEQRLNLLVNSRLS